MSGTSFGVGFTIGASLAPTVASAFSTLGQKIKASGSELGRLRQISGKLAVADDLRANSAKIQAEMQALQGRRAAMATQMTALRSQAAAGSSAARAELRQTRAAYATLGAQMDALRPKYEAARKKSDEYAASVKQLGMNQQQAAAAMARTEKRLALQTSAQGHQDTSREMRGRMVESMVPAMAMAAPINSAIQFESAMADAAKTIDGARDASGKLTPKYYEMEAAVKEMGRTLPLTHDELAKLFAAGGQQGMTGTDELKEFTTLSAQMAVAFGMTTEEAADSIGGMRTALKLSMPEARSLLDLMNQYANTGSASEKGIAEIVSRIGPLGNVAGVSAKSIAALGATLDSMKVAPEIAATGIKNLMLSMVSGTAATKSQRKAYAALGFDTVKLAKEMQKNGPAAILSVLKAVKKLPKDKQASMLQELFGKESIGAIAPLLDSLDLVEKNLIISTDETKYAGAVQQEFENRSKTTANALILAGNKAREMGIAIGSVVLPAIVQTLDVVGPYITGLATLASQHKTVTTVVVGAVAGFVAMRTIGFGVMWVYHGVASVVGGVRAALLALTAVNARSTAAMVLHKAAAIGMGIASKAAAAGQWILNAAMSANPVGIVVKAVALLVGSMITLYNTCEPVRLIFDKVFSFIGEKFAWATEKLAALWGGIKSMGSWIGLGDDEEGTEEKAGDAGKEKAGLTPAVAQSTAVPPDAGVAGKAAPANATPAMTQPAQPSGAGMGQPSAMPASTSVSANFTFNLPPMPDADFAQRVIQGLSSRKSDVERLISGIVHDQMRVAYGN